MAHKRVLILDDQQNQIQALAGYLKKFEHGNVYAIATASNGAEAAQALRGGRPDLILIDPQMKGVDGLALLKQVRALDRSIPVIVVTNRQAKTVAAEVLQLGAFAYVPKPCDYLQLEHLVGLVFSGAFNAAGSA
ncbi:MAG: response regulator [candidate division NC10 bacterium]